MAPGVTAIAYETMTDADGSLPLLAPMSHVAGRMAVQVAAHFLERPHGRRGILLGSIDRALEAEVLVLGGGVVRSNAAEIALALGANVMITVRSPTTLRHLTEVFDGRAKVMLTPADTSTLCKSADVVIGAALVAGAAAPKLISAETVRQMKPGAVIVDVSIDQGDCAETSHPTTHSQPTFLVDDVVHYCVANMPGAVPRTSTFALNDATRPFILSLADKGISQALAGDEHLRNGLNVHAGRITYRAVAEALQLAYTRALDALDA